MKKVLLFALSVLFIYLVGCDDSPNKVTGDSNAVDGNAPAKRDKNISSRDYSITAANSYSDLFLDSSSLEDFINKKKISDTIARRMRSFYNTRNYQYAWFNTEGFTEQANSFWNAVMYYTSVSDDTSVIDKKLKSRMNRLLSEDTLSFASSNAPRETEFALTDAFLKYSLRNFDNDFVKRKELERFIPRRKENTLQYADSLLSKKHKDNKYFEDINAPYKALKDYLQKYYDIAKQGGWPTIPTIKKPLKQGHSYTVLPAIKKYLYSTGDLTTNDTSSVFNDTLKQAVKSFQERLGLTPTGVINNALRKEMNVPVEKRIGQILINMDRMRWMPANEENDLIVVNIPEFEMHVMKDGKKLFDMDIVVGKEGTHTTMFTGTLNQVIFNPYWNVPPSIVQKEILKEIKKDRDYLKKNDMEITGHNDSLPEIRQLPGDKNALGKVKFIFRNSFNIYFHDTPEKGLFTKDKRAFSHGCIRLREPEKMADYLLSSNPDWDPEKINKELNSKSEKPLAVSLKKSVEVLITYYTAWVDENGKLNLREDIYGHDRTMSERMFND